MTNITIESLAGLTYKELLKAGKEVNLKGRYKMKVEELRESLKALLLTLKAEDEAAASKNEKKVEEEIKISAPIEEEEVPDFLEEETTETTETTETIVEEVEKTEDLKPEKSEKSKKPENEEEVNRKKPHYVLLDDNENEVIATKNKAQMIKYCVENNIANAGWVKTSIWNKTKMYIHPQTGKVTRSKNSKYTGVGYQVIEVAEDEITE